MNEYEMIELADKLEELTDDEWEQVVGLDPHFRYCPDCGERNSQCDC